MTSAGSDEVLRIWEAQVHLAERLGDLWHLAHALNCLSGQYTDKGDFTKGLLYDNQAVETAERLGDPALLAFMLVSRSEVSFPSGDWRAAREDSERAVTTLRQLGPTWSFPGALFTLGRLYLAEGQKEEAMRLLEEALTLAASNGTFDVGEYTQSVLAERDLLEGRLQEARARLGAMGERSDRLSIFAGGRVPPLMTLAWVHLELDEERQAEVLIEQALAHARPRQLRFRLVEALRLQALLRVRQQRWEEAQAALEEALALAHAMLYPYAEAKTLYGYGQFHAQKGEPEQARERFQAGLTICERLGERLYGARIESEQARLASK